MKLTKSTTEYEWVSSWLGLDQGAHLSVFRYEHKRFLFFKWTSKCFEGGAFLNDRDPHELAKEIIRSNATQRFKLNA